MNTPAFPAVAYAERHGSDNYSFETAGGLTKRELFAALAMQGYIAKGGLNPEAVAVKAVQHADALLRELEVDG